MYNQQNLYKYSATLGYIGYLPASGTAASLITLPVAYYATAFDWYPILVIGLIAISFLLIKKALPLFAKADPSEIVIDEVAGMGCAFLFVWWLRHYNSDLVSWQLLAGTFFLFRLLDITKGGMNRLEQWCTREYGAFGVLVDDLIAGILAAFIMYLIVLWH